MSNLMETIAPLQFASQDGYAFINILNTLDVTLLVKAIKRDCKWSDAQTQDAIQRYLRFLCLIYLYPNRLLVPTEAIDRVWHCHILMTRQYRADCQKLFGDYLDHEPDFIFNENFDESNDFLTQKLSTAFVQTKFLFEKHFGQGSFDQSNPESTNQSVSDLKSTRESNLEFDLRCDRPTTDIHQPAACGRPANRID